MTTLNKIWLAVLSVAVLGLMVVGGASAPAGGLIHVLQEEFPEGITVDGTEVISTAGRWVGTVTGIFNGTTITASGETAVEGFTAGAGALATSTTGTATTLSQADLLADNLFVVTWNTSSGTYTLPASSTWTTLIPNAGDVREWIFHNATTTAATTMTIAAGTGIDLVAVTTADDVIDGTEYSQMTCVRQPDTDVTCIVNELLHAD